MHGRIQRTSHYCVQSVDDDRCAHPDGPATRAVARTLEGNRLLLIAAVPRMVDSHPMSTLQDEPLPVRSIGALVGRAASSADDTDL